MDNDSKTAIVVVGHGSRLPETKEVYEGMAELAAGKSGYQVKVGYMKHWKPSIYEAVTDYIDNGYKRIVVVPAFLLKGLHVTDDIPIILGLKEGRTDDGSPIVQCPPDVEILYGNNLGVDERLADIIIDRAEEVMGK